MSNDWPEQRHNDGFGLVSRKEEHRCRTSQWSKDLARWDREARAADCIEEIRLKRHRLDALWQCIRYTPVGVLMAKRKSTAAMNARYVGRTYVGKRKTDARKAKRAAAARDRRARDRYAISEKVMGAIQQQTRN